MNPSGILYINIFHRYLDKITFANKKFDSVGINTATMYRHILSKLKEYHDEFSFDMWDQSKAKVGIIYGDISAHAYRRYLIRSGNFGVVKFKLETLAKFQPVVYIEKREKRSSSSFYYFDSTPRKVLQSEGINDR